MYCVIESGTKADPEDKVEGGRRGENSTFEIEFVHGIYFCRQRVMLEHDSLLRKTQGQRDASNKFFGYVHGIIICKQVALVRGDLLFFWRGAWSMEHGAKGIERRA